MKSLAFPEMFTSSKTLVVTDHEATFQNFSLMIKSEVNTLFGDPEFGTKLKSVFYSQKNVALQDFIIEEIYTSVQKFIPQLQVYRENITIVYEEDGVYVEIISTNLIDYETDLYKIKLLDTNDIEGE